MTCYYKILGTDPSSTFNEIKSAYRKKALTCHPDRGGSHEAMVKVNEAWEVLSNTKLRKQYDDLLKQDAEVDQEFADARKRAESYPMSWDKFDQWLGAIGRDFTEASYGSTEFMGFGVPTGGNSFSGWLFILGGGLLGLCLAGILYATLLPEPNSNSGLFGETFQHRQSQKPNPIVARFIFVGLGIAGAWLGRLLHGGAGSILGLWFSKLTASGHAKSNSTNPESNSCDDESAQRTEPREIRRVSCPKCNQSLKIPSVDREVVVTCPKCQNRFDVSNPSDTEEKPPMQFPPNKKTLTTIFKGLLIAEISIAAMTIPILWIESQIIQDRGLVIDDPDFNVFVSAIYALLFLIMLPVAITSWVGLFRFRNWARWLYAGLFVFANLIFIPISCFQLSVNWGLTMFISDLSSYITGAILAVIMLSPLAIEFRNPTQPEPE